jgi:hypothetical protein
VSSIGSKVSSAEGCRKWPNMWFMGTVLGRRSPPYAAGVNGERCCGGLNPPGAVVRRRPGDASGVMVSPDGGRRDCDSDVHTHTHRHTPRAAPRQPLVSAAHMLECWMGRLRRGKAVACGEGDTVSVGTDGNGGTHRR